MQNPHDYKDLLEIAYGRIVPPEKARELATEDLEHEFQHHVPALGQPGHEMRYGVEFVQDIRTGKIGATPSISHLGTTRVGVIRKVFEGPSEKSQTDEIFLRKK